MDDLVYHYLDVLDRLGLERVARRRRLAGRLAGRRARRPLARADRAAGAARRRRAAGPGQHGHRHLPDDARPGRDDALPRPGGRRGHVPGRARRRLHPRHLPRPGRPGALRLGARTSTTPSSSAGCTGSRRPTLVLWADDDRVIPHRARPPLRRAHPRRDAADRRGLRPRACTSSRPRRSPTPSPSSSSADRRARHEVRLLPPHAVPVPARRLRRALRLAVAGLPQQALRPASSATSSTTATSTSSSTPSELGFDGIAVNEHHQTAYGLMPSPNIMAAALARRTSTRQGHGPRQRDRHPRPSAAGRRGDRDARPPHRRAPRLGLRARHRLGVLRALDQPDALARALQRGPRPDHQGVDDRRGRSSGSARNYEFRYVNVWPRPLQEPHPPIYIPGAGSTETMNCVPRSATRTWCADPGAQRCRARHRRAVPRGLRAQRLSRHEQIGWGIGIYVAETDAQAVAEYEPHFWYYAKNT